MRIGLDLDGVIIDHRQNKHVLARDYGYALEPWQANANVIRDVIPEPHASDLHAKLYSHLTLAAPPMDGAIEHLARLPGEVFIVSARRERSAPYAEMWLLNSGILHQVIPKERIHFVGGGAEKPAAIERLGLDVFLDDEAGVLRGLPGSVRRFFFDPDGVAGRLGLDPGIAVVRGWSEFALHL
jgi:hypothetical protein